LSPSRHGLCKRLARIDKSSDFRICVNLSAAMLGLGAAEMIEGVLKSTGAVAERLTVEITETAALLDRPAALGCGVAIDDFGAGQASLGYVVKLPTNRIKLDASLIAVFQTNVRARAAIAATAQLATDIGADVAAEGARSAEAAEGLAALGVALG
jgi:EAL domain-containing protein (putative c-di-GMP-specific phosphodiesterase class I)